MANISVTCSVLIVIFCVSLSVGVIGKGSNTKANNEELRLELLNEIKSIDHMKCFPKILCGLSLESTKSKTAFNSQLLRSYVQLMRSDLPENFGDNDENIRGDDAMSQFLLRSGLLTKKSKDTKTETTKKHKSKVVVQSSAASSSEEDEEEDDFRQDQDDHGPYSQYQYAYNKKRIEEISGEDILPSYPYHLINNYKEKDKNDKNKKEKKTGSLLQSWVPSWVPWVSFSMQGEDRSFEKDPFFKKRMGKLPGKKQENRKLDDNDKPSSTEARGFPQFNEEIQLYATAVDIGKRLGNIRQCDIIFNGCPLPYKDIIQVITAIRNNTQDVQRDDKDTTIDGLSQAVLDYSKEKSKDKKRPQKPSEDNRTPVAQISHILPNGEKVEINVQLSPNPDEKPEEELQQDASELSPQEPLVASKISPSSPFNEGLINVPDVIDDSLELEDPNASTISASYELPVNEKENVSQEDHRKPTPLEIFKKVSSPKKRTTTTTTTTAKPRRSTTQRIVTTTTTKRPNRNKAKPTRRPTGQSETGRPTFITTTSTTKRPTSRTKSRPRPRTTPASTTSSTMKAVVADDEDEDVEYTTRKVKPSPKPTTKTPTSKPKNRTTISPMIYSNENVSEEDLPQTRRTSTTKRPEPPTIAPLAMFTKTYMDEVMAHFDKSATTEDPVKRLSHLVMGQGHGHSAYVAGNLKRRRKPPMVLAASPPLLVEDAYMTSVESSGSGETSSSKKKGGIITSSDTWYSKEHEVMPGSSETYPTTDPELDMPEFKPKKRIQYKLPKRPYLVLMRPGDN